MYNKLILIGNLTKNVEVKYLQSGTQIANFGIASNIKRGEKKEVFFGDVTAFGKLAEICGQYLSKGSRIMLEGRLITESWESNGKKQYKTKIIAENIRFLDSKKADDSIDEPIEDSSLEAF